MSVSIEGIRGARERIAPFVRRTPEVRVVGAREWGWGEAEVRLKLESLQVSGSFKARGAVNKVMGLAEGARGRGLVTASGGNHGAGVAYAGWLAGTPATVIVPRSTPAEKARRIERWGARVRVVGEVWDDANDAALEAAEREGLTYVHPFADEEVMAGQGTIALEILEEGACDVFVIAIGGGGLIAGMSTAIRALAPKARVIGVEPVGAPTLRASLDAGYAVTLPAITTAAGTLAPRRSTEDVVGIVRANVDDVVLVSDEEMGAAAGWLFEEMGVATELSGAAAMAALLAGRVKVAAGERVSVLVCGAGAVGVR